MQVRWAIVSSPQSFRRRETISIVLPRVLPSAPYVTETKSGSTARRRSTAAKNAGQRSRSRGEEFERDERGASREQFRDAHRGFPADARADPRGETPKMIPHRRSVGIIRRG